MKPFVKAVAASFISFQLIACGNVSADLAALGLDSDVSKIDGEKAFVRISLTDAPNDNLTSVFVNVSHMELMLEKGGKKSNLIIGKNLGVIDLLTLRDGVLLPLQDIEMMPDQVSVKQIRLVLNEDGHSAVKVGGATCVLQTPSAQKSGVKIIIKNGVTFEKDYMYHLVVDFDAKKSIVQKGNGDCLLKPVLKLKEAKRISELDVNPVDGSWNEPGEDLVDGTDGNDTTTGDGFDPYDPNTWGEDITEEELNLYY